MTYQETIDYLFSRLPMFGRQGGAAYKPGLARIQQICNTLGNPQSSYPTIHVAGTNGKGSVANMLASVLVEAGYKVGLYTSPHFKDFRERIKVNAQCIPKKEVVAFVERFKEADIEPSFFEYSTAMAFDYFKKARVDIAIIETGMGGRLDSTNVVTPILSVITKIGLDHTQFLGDTLEAIAGEKAGIIKPQTPVVIGPDISSVQAVFRNAAQRTASTVYEAKTAEQTQEELPFHPTNIALAKKALEVLQDLGFPHNKAALTAGLRETVNRMGFFGRWYTHASKPNTYYDVAHNPSGVAHVLKKMQALAPFDQWNVVLGMVADKDHISVLEQLPKEAHYFACAADIPRALQATELHQKMQETGLHAQLHPKVTDALQAAEANQRKYTAVFGSFFVVAEALPEEIFKKFQ